MVVGGGDPRAAARASVAASKMRPWADARPLGAAAGGSPCGLSRACRGAFDAARAGDAARAADRRSPQEAAVVVGGAHSRVRALYRHKLS